MEEEGVVKAPVTRLRRRMSVEQSDDTKSPSTPSTPTKKRAGRLVAKPQLELIDENAPQNTPKRATRRSMARDAEPAEEKPVTPARRSARVKSNTSLVLEMETATSVESPRAKRAARRNSQVGSDNEAPLTPARTRRTRKDSSSSVEKLASETPVTPARTRHTRKDSTSSDKQADEPVSKSTVLITEIISEEPEIDQQKGSIIVGVYDEPTDQNSSSSPRQSPRLKAKKERNSTSSRSDNENNDKLSQDNNLNIIPIVKESISKENDLKALESGSTPKLKDNADGKTKSNDLQNNRISICSVNLIKCLDEVPKKKMISMNKSASAINQSNSSEPKRHRTKSWTNLTVPLSNESYFLSDNESTKKNLKNHEVMFKKNLSNQAGSGDSNTTSDNIDEYEKTRLDKDNTGMNLHLSSKKNKKRNENKNKTDNNSIIKEVFHTNKSKDVNESVTGIRKDTVAGTSNESNKENFDEVTSKNYETKTTELLFHKPTNSILQSMVFIEDSDSNTDSLGKNKQLDGEDQCVPVVDHELKSKDTVTDPNTNLNTTEQKVTNNNYSCEPMDIDETIPDNIILNDSSPQDQLEENQLEDKGSRKSSLCISPNIVGSKRKSSLSNSISQDLEKSGNENKSTLVLSQIKDTSTEHNAHQSLQERNNELLSKSVNLPNVPKVEITNHNLSLNYLTSTPVQHKDIKKLGMHMNTSVITPCNEGKKEIMDSKNTTTKELSKSSNNSDSSEDEQETEESSKEKNDFVDDKAEDAGEDYESGDSQDEEERKYERDHEVLEHGETLTSEDEVSNDSDYERDSFVVSSDEEDNYLLSCSGDDLDMSVNELTMSAKSKKKFNERSKKQQKSASKEMFEARHNLIATKSSSKEKQGKVKNKRRRLDSSLLESEEDNSLPPRKNKRMRLDSTWESSINESVDDEVVSKDKNTSEAVLDTSEVGPKKKKKVNTLSDSFCENSIYEKVGSNSENKSLTIDKPIADEDEPKNKKKAKRSAKSIISENCTVDDLVNDEIQHRTETGECSSESLSTDNTLNEKEITIYDRSSGKDDPLLTTVKQEPKTPNKGLEISTIQFTTREDIEHVNVDENTSVMKPHASLDPLQATMAHENEEDDDSSLNEDDSVNSSISENEEITNNYDCILKELNKEMTCKQIKSFDMSLNKKAKEKVKEPIIAELNITQTKKSNNKTKSKPVNTELEVVGNKVKSVVKKIRNNSDDESTSDSINLRLLFSEESNDSSKSNTEADEHFIPLKRTEGKTNIRINANEIEEKESSLNICSNKKNKKQRQNEMIETASLSPTLNKSLMEISQSNKKNKMPKLMQSENATMSENEIGQYDISLNNSFKNKRKSSQNESKGCGNVNETAENVSLSLNTSSKNKNKHKSQNEDDAHATEIVGNESLNTSSKKKRKKRKLSQDEDNAVASETITDNFFIDTIGTHKAENKSINDSLKKSPEKIKKLKYFANDDKIAPVAGNETEKKNANKKRKDRDDDDVGVTKSKMLKHSSFDEIIPRLPATIINALEDKPRKVFEVKKSKAVVSTTEFLVEDNKRKNKPSNFLEQTVYLNTDTESPDVKKNAHIKKPKVLPFIPTASTSYSGFTTNFKVSIIPQKMEFVAQSSNGTNFNKNDYLYNKKIKKLRTYELYRQHRNIKLSKF